MENTEEKIINKCEECMFDAPYAFCCKRMCNYCDFCKKCIASSRGSLQLGDRCLYDIN